MDFRNENDEIINLYFREKCSIKNIARRTNTSRNKVASIIKEKKSSFKNEEIFFDNSHYQVFPKIFQFNSIDFLISQYKIMPIVVPKAYLRGFY